MEFENPLTNGAVQHVPDSQSIEDKDPTTRNRVEETEASEVFIVESNNSSFGE
jgi:hypothetical protein